jgi:stage V sporulation protein SpoVS
MKNARQALARQLARAERLARQPPNHQKIAGALAEVIERLRIEVRALDQEGSAARAEAVAALARQALNVTETLMRLNQRSGNP